MTLTAKKMSLKQKLNLARSGELPQPDMTPSIKPKEPIPVYHIRANYHNKENQDGKDESGEG